MKNNGNGITLIALIITIIVMLILVGVTINVALNGGLFDKAKIASDGTQKETDREALISAVVGTLDNNGIVVFDGDEGLDNNLPDEFEKVSKGVYKNKKTGKEYKVDLKTGNVEEYTSTSQTQYSFTIADLFNKAIEESDGAGGVSSADFISLLRVESLDELNEYYDEDYSFMKFITSNSSILRLSDFEDTVDSGQYGLGLIYDSEYEVFMIFLLNNNGSLEICDPADKVKIDEFASYYASTIITLQPLSEKKNCRGRIIYPPLFFIV